MLLLPASGADAAPVRGFADPIFGSQPGRDAWLGQATAAGARLIRLDVSWRGVAPAAPPLQGRSPADPSYDFSRLDAAVRDATAHGLQVMLTVYDAPDWAEGPNPRGSPPGGTWEPNPVAYGAFGEALARRYSGGFAPSPGEAPLPRVGYFEVWNEPNLDTYLTPQWRNYGRVSDDHYRKLLNAFYDGVHKGNRRAKVIAGATAPFGDDWPDTERVRPLDFMRELLCLGKGKRSRPKKCPQPAHFDIYSHHPINIYGGPRKSGRDPDDAPAVTDMLRSKRLLRIAEREGTVRPRRRHVLWATELWWQTKPPDRRDGFPMSTAVRYIQEALYLSWKQGIGAVLWYQILDSPTGPRGYEGLQAGLFFADGTPKPLLEAFRFPFVTERRSNSEVLAWSIPPESGQLLIQRKAGGGWRTIERGRAVAGKPFHAMIKLRGAASLRAGVNGDASLTWRQGAASSGKRGKHRRLAYRPRPVPAITADPALAPYYEAFGG